MGSCTTALIVDALESKRDLLYTVFSLYTSPIEDIILAHGLSVLLYADDTQL